MHKIKNKLKTYLTLTQLHWATSGQKMVETTGLVVIATVSELENLNLKPRLYEGLQAVVSQ